MRGDITRSPAPIEMKSDKADSQCKALCGYTFPAHLLKYVDCIDMVGVVLDCAALRSCAPDDYHRRNDLRKLLEPR